LVSKRPTMRIPNPKFYEKKTINNQQNFYYISTSFRVSKIKCGI
jgi:hypothetical protein